MFRGDAQDPCVQWVTLTQTCMWNNGAASEGSTAQEGQEPSEGRAEDTASLNTGSRRGAEQTGGGQLCLGPRAQDKPVGHGGHPVGPGGAWKPRQGHPWKPRRSFGSQTPEEGWAGRGQVLQLPEG